jgi:hypothetical protein
MPDLIKRVGCHVESDRNQLDMYLWSLKPVIAVQDKESDMPIAW